MSEKTLYIETSAIGFYYDKMERNRDKRNAVRTLFKQIRLGLFDAFVSRITLAEIQNSREPYRTRDIKLLKKNSIVPLEVDRTKARRLYQLYKGGNILPSDEDADLLHIAYFTLSDMNVLVTYNCEHLANINIVKKVKMVNEKEGYRTDFNIATPEEVIYYDKI